MPDSNYYHSRARMGRVVANVAEYLQRRNVGRATKSINEVTREYNDTLIRWVVDAANGNMTAGAMATAWRPLLIEDARAVYIEGMREGGIKDPEAEMDDTDESAIGDWILSQTPHIYPFADDAVAVSKLNGDEKSAARTVMLGRVDNWVMALESLGRSGTAKAKGDPMMTFGGEDGNESCAECQRYKGQRHKRSWWESRGLLGRPNENFGCGRYDNCQHDFSYDDGSAA